MSLVNSSNRVVPASAIFSVPSGVLYGASGQIVSGSALGTGVLKVNGSSAPALLAAGDSFPAGVLLSGTGAGTAPSFMVVAASDPRSVALDKPIGSTAIDSSGNLFLKTGSGTTDWLKIAGTLPYVNVGANATTVTLSGLNGDLDVAYKIIAVAKYNGSAAVSIDVRPNGTTTNRRRCVVYSTNGGAPNAAAAADWALFDTHSTDTCVFEATLWAKRGGGGRGIVSLAMETTSAVPALTSLFTTGTWLEDATNITSIDFTASGANGIGAGSMFCAIPIGLVR